MKKENTLKTNKEKARHGDIFLPVNSYHCLIPFTYRELALHWHEEMEITLIQDGTSDYKVGQKVFEANAGDIILIPPYCTHSACEIPGNHTDTAILYSLSMRDPGKDDDIRQYGVPP